MRVLHVLHTSLPFICGYSIRSDYIIRNQRELGICPAVVTSSQHPDDASQEETIGGTTHWRTPAIGTKPPVVRELALMRALNRRLDWAIREWKPDVLHAHSPMLVGLPALAASRRHGLPLVYEVRDLWENASVDRKRFSERSPQYRVARALETSVLRRADAVVAICEQLRLELVGRARRADGVHVVANGVDATQFMPRPGDPAAAARWGVEGKHLLGYVGTFQPYEGLDLLLKSLPAILERDPLAHAIIAGSGGQEAQLKALAASAGLNGHVTFTGRVPHEEVGAIYSLASVMVYPRVLTRTTALTTPLKPLEAMAMSKCVVVSDVPAMRELVEHRDNGLIFRAGDPADLAEQCIALLTSPSMQAEIGTRARERVLKERQWPQLVSAYSAIYQAAIRSARRDHSGSPLAAPAQICNPGSK